VAVGAGEGAGAAGAGSAAGASGACWAASAFFASFFCFDPLVPSALRVALAFWAAAVRSAEVSVALFASSSAKSASAVGFPAKAPSR